MTELKNAVLEILNEKPILMDAFDSNYLMDFHHILRENFNINSLSDVRLEKIVNITNIDKNLTVLDLRNQLLQVLDQNDFLPFQSSEEMKARQKYNNVDGWAEYKNVTVTNNLEKVKEFLAKYSQQSGGQNDISQEDFLRNWGRTPELRIAQEKIIENYIKQHPQASMLSIGPRWPAEITFLRDRFKINVMGLDLFTNDSSKIIAGDMHDIPVPDNSYDIVYEKNTYNKSYDIRKALDESVRVLKPGGLLIYDECMDYTCGVNENARTNIKSHEWTISYLRDTINEVLVAEEISSEPSEKWWLNKVGLFIARVK